MAKFRPCQKPINRSFKNLIIGVIMVANNQKNLYGIPYEQ